MNLFRETRYEKLVALRETRYLKNETRETRSDREEFIHWINHHTVDKCYQNPSYCLES